MQDFDIDLQTPDQFVLNQIMLTPTRALASIKTMRPRRAKPTISAIKLVSLFEQRELPQTAAHLRDVIDLI